MNAIMDAKRELAAGWLENLPTFDDWRAPRAAEAREWLAANGGPHKRDVYWGYTDPRLLVQEHGQGASTAVSFDGVALLANSQISNDDVTISPIETTPNELFGRLVTAAHALAPRPLAERTLARASGLYIHVTGDAGTFTIDRDAWPDDFYIGIKMDAGASMTLIETGSAAATKNAVIESDLADEALLDHLRLSATAQDHYHAHLFADMGEHAHLHSFTLAQAAQFRRFESMINLNGDHGHVSIAGANLLNGKCMHDDTIYITHDAQHCTSRQVFKRVVNEGAISVFQGKILVKQIAQKTDGYQISQGLMLDDGAQILSKPELEIYADDVICSHGSTTSGLDDTALFYLQSRGVPADMAEKLLVRAFIQEAIEEIRDETLQARFGTLAEEWIFGHAL